MNIFGLQLLSRFPETLIGGSTYYKLCPITALRFRINGFLLPSAIRIKNNARVIYEENVQSTRGNTHKKFEYYNIWLNLTNIALPYNHISIEFKYIGFYINVKSLKYVFIDEASIHLTKQSDRYINPSELAVPSVDGDDLEREIKKLPASIRSASTSSIKREINSILIMRLDQLGDFILTISAITELKKLNPSAHITILVSPSNEGIARGVSLFDEIFVVPFSFIEKTNHRSVSDEARDFIKSSLHQHHFDIAIDLSPMPETRELLSLVNADTKFGFENTNTSMMDFGILIHAKDPINWLSNVSHASYSLILIDAVKRVCNPVITHISNKNKNANILNELQLTADNYIVVHSGARNILVRWPIEKFIQITERLVNNGQKVVFFADEKLTDKFRKLLTLKKVIIMDYKIDFHDFDDIISNSRIFIGNDSGPKHLAAMREIPVVSIHSPRTNWTEWGQIDSGYIVSSRVPCAGCTIVNDQECAKGLTCIRDISVDDVMSAINKI